MTLESLIAGDQEVRIEAGAVTLVGILNVPANVTSIVLFVHGSGSSRFSRRNRCVARQLQGAGVATLLFDLLTAEEDAIDRYTADYRFDIPLLAERLVFATDWVDKRLDNARLPLGYFGASTDAAAALTAATLRADRVSAIVCRGGRPDLASDTLAKVRAPTLLIVGGDDELVLRLNEDALTSLGTANKQLSILPGATHLFEEPGKLEQVSQLATEWFTRYLVVER